MPNSFLNNLKNDLPAGLAVFFVAIPLCLGLAHASGAPLLSGLISGIVGGIVVGSLSASPLSVGGPANSMTALVIMGIQDLGNYEAVLVAIILAGLVQIIFSLLRVSLISKYIPNCVISGMLVAIGLILIFKQFPHLFGYDVEVMGVEEFILTDQDYSGVNVHEQNTFTTVFHTLSHINPVISVVGLLSVFMLFLWEKFPKVLRIIPGSIIVVILGAFALFIYRLQIPDANITADHFVNIPVISGFNSFWEQTSNPNWSALSISRTYILAITIAIIASLETLLSIEAIEKLDPLHRSTPMNRELFAQGIGNSISGLLGGLPITSVIARSTVNVSSGAVSKASTIIHGILICIGVFYFATFINAIPLTSLAAILVYTGYKLVNPKIILKQFKQGWDQFIPTVITLAAILLSDLLIGVAIGLIVSMLFIVAKSYHATSFTILRNDKKILMQLGESVHFLHKYKFVKFLKTIPANTVLEIDSSRTLFIDHDIEQVLLDFEHRASDKNVRVVYGQLLRKNSNEEETNNAPQ